MQFIKNISFCGLAMISMLTIFECKKIVNLNVNLSHIQARDLQEPKLVLFKAPRDLANPKLYYSVKAMILLLFYI